ncbi:hypothetical protein GCM10007967_19830 [Xylanimonas ulmi]
MFELRLAGVSGADVGASLAEVESHVVDSGETARDAFGEPADYARSLGLPTAPDQTTAATLRTVWPVVLWVPGMMAAITAAPEAATGANVIVRVSVILATLLAVATFVLAARWAAPLLRAAVSHRWGLLAITILVGLTFVLLALLLATGALTIGGNLDLPSRWVVSVGLLAVAAGTVWAQIAAPRTVDVIRAPLDDDDASQRGPVMAARVVLLLPLLLTVALVVAGWGRAT